jgi:hypothetical protein
MLADFDTQNLQNMQNLQNLQNLQNTRLLPSQEKRAPMRKIHITYPGSGTVLPSVTGFYKPPTPASASSSDSTAPPFIYVPVGAPDLQNELSAFPRKKIALTNKPYHGHDTHRGPKPLM